MALVATHKGIYGHGEPGFFDLDVFWTNMSSIVTAAPFVFGVYMVAAIASLAQMIKARGHSDPVSRAPLAAFIAFAAQLVATSKHFALHYMMASWVLTGGVLVLAIIQTRRLVPAIPAGVLAGAGAAACAILVPTTLSEVRRDAIQTAALDDVGA